MYFLYFRPSLPLNFPPAWSLPRVPACPSFALPRHSFPHLSRSLLTYLLTLNLLLLLASICLSAHTRLRTNPPSEFPAGFLHVSRFSSYWRRGWCRTIACDMGALITTEGGIQGRMLMRGKFNIYAWEMMQQKTATIAPQTEVPLVLVLSGLECGQIVLQLIFFNLISAIQSIDGICFTCCTWTKYAAAGED